MRLKCIECDHVIEIMQGATSYNCENCGHSESWGSEKSSTDFEEHTFDDFPDSIDVERIDEAENYFLQATFIHHSLQANISVYGSNSGWSGAEPADVDLALKYLNRCLEIWPENPKYLNLKALFLIEGKGDKEGGLELMEQAAQLAPDDITIQDNLEKSKEDSCFVASAVFMSESALEVRALRSFRDQTLQKSKPGRAFVRLYYEYGPALARLVQKFPSSRIPLRWSLSKLASAIRSDE